MPTEVKQHQQAEKTEVEILRETVGKLEHSLKLSKLHSVVEYLSEEQSTALRGKINVADYDRLKAVTPGVSDILVSYLVFKAQDESNDRLFSLVKNGMVLELVGLFRQAVSEDADVSKDATSKILNMGAAITASQRVNLLESLKKGLLTGKTGMDKDTERAYTNTCLVFGIDPKRVR